ncbi:MAG: prolipoprotein diacylglyceryl transferase [Planctomycetota bacterium]|nr:prolipoprotein diacylglyceryl transferase [Planctomycetota bacterium]
MYPILFRLENVPLFDTLTLRSFGVLVLLGVIAGVFWMQRAFPRIGLKHPDAPSDVTMWMLLTGFFGARLVYLIIHPSAFHGPLSLIALWEGGIVSYGGFIGGAVGVAIYARKKRVPFLRIADAITPALCIGQAVGRWGCLLAGDDHGRPWDGPWAVTFPSIEETLIPPDLIGIPLHPAQIYLSLMNLILFLILARAFAKRRYAGQVLCLGMVLYPIGRFLVEYTRGDDISRGFWGAFSTAQWVSMIILCLALALWRRARQQAMPISSLTA